MEDASSRFGVPPGGSSVTTVSPPVSPAMEPFPSFEQLSSQQAPSHHGQAKRFSPPPREDAWDCNARSVQQSAFGTGASWGGASAACPMWQNDAPIGYSNQGDLSAYALGGGVFAEDDGERMSPPRVTQQKLHVGVGGHHTSLSFGDDDVFGGMRRNPPCACICGCIQPCTHAVEVDLDTPFHAPLPPFPLPNRPST